MEKLMLHRIIFRGTVDVETMLVIGVAIMLLGAVLFGVMYAHKAGHAFVAASGCAVLFGALIFVLAKSGKADKAMSAFIFGCGVLATTVSVYLLYIPKRCNKQIRAVYMSSAIKTKDGTLMFAPIFDYTYNGKRYINRSAELYSYKEMRRFVEGDSVDIYIDPKDPKICILKRKYRVLYILIAVAGIAAAIFALLAVFTNMVHISIV